MSQKLTKQEAFDLLLDACPEAMSALDEQRTEYGDLPYLDMAVFARQVVESYKEGRTEIFPRFFTVVERLIIAGDDEVRGLAIVGFLEALQNNASWADFGPAVFVQWLGPNSLNAWNELNQLWEGKQSLMDVLRSQK
jgi:hypothetical protein